MYMTWDEAFAYVDSYIEKTGQTERLGKLGPSQLAILAPMLRGGLERVKRAERAASEAGQSTAD